MNLIFLLLFCQLPPVEFADGSDPIILSEQKTSSVEIVSILNDLRTFRKSIVSWKDREIRSIGDHLFGQALIYYGMGRNDKAKSLALKAREFYESGYETKNPEEYYYDLVVRDYVLDCVKAQDQFHAEKIVRKKFPLLENFRFTKRQ